jgi:hypothetical protein
MKRLHIALLTATLLVVGALLCTVGPVQRAISQGAVQITTLVGTEQISLDYPCTVSCFVTTATLKNYINAGGGGGGTVTSITAGTGLSGGVITNSGTIACALGTTSTIGCLKPDGTTITVSAGVITATSGGGSIGTIFPPYWGSINVNDYYSGVTCPTGASADSCAIQAAIDAASAAKIQTVYLPHRSSCYAPNVSMYLDVPGNLRGGGSAWSSSTTYSQGQIINVSGINYASLVGSNLNNPPASSPSDWHLAAYNSGTTYALNDTTQYAGVMWISLAGSNTGNTPSVTSTYWAQTISSINTADSFSMTLAGDVAGNANHEGFGTQICPTFNNGTALWLGAGRGMGTKSIQIIGPNNAYRGNLNVNGVGVAVAELASRTKIIDTEVDNYYNCFLTGPNGADLADSNAFIRPVWSNCYNGINFYGIENWINQVQDPECDSTICITSIVAKNVTVLGGNLSATSGRSNAFTIGSISSLTATNCGNSNYCYTFTGVITSPDIYIPSVYNSYMFVTADFGVVPVIMNSWNSGTNTGTFEILPMWGYFYFQPGTNALTISNLQSEIQAVTTLYAAERVTTFYGPAFDAVGVHVENPTACTTFIDAFAGFGGDNGITIERSFFNYDPSLNQYKPANSPSPAQLALFYCQQSFPFIFDEPNGAAYINLRNNNFGQLPSSDPVIIDLAENGFNNLVISGSRNTLVNPSMRNVSKYQAVDAGDISGGYFAAYTAGLGGGEWDQTPFLATNYMAQGQLQNPQVQIGGSMSPFIGWYPANWLHPRITPSQYSILENIGTTTLGTYMLPAGATVYDILNCRNCQSAAGQIAATSSSGAVITNSGTNNLVSGQPISFQGPTLGGLTAGVPYYVLATSLTATTFEVAATIGGSAITPSTSISATVTPYISAVSAHKGFSYGQELTTSNIATLAWSYLGQSFVVKLDAGTLSWMFDGLVVDFNNGSGDVSYVVTGVYPSLGYITVLNITNDGFPDLLAGTNTVTYNGTSIDEPAYSWTQYQFLLKRDLDPASNDNTPAFLNQAA